MAAVPKATQTIGLFATFGDETGIDGQGLLMLWGNHGGDGRLVERDPIEGSLVPARKGLLMIRTVATHIAKSRVSREHEQES